MRSDVPRNERELQSDAVRRLERDNIGSSKPDAGRFAERRSWWDRTTDEVAAWFGNPGALRRRQWDEAAGDHRGEGPVSQVDDDTRIVDELNKRLTDDPELNASHIVATSQDGLVTLSGAVTTNADRSRAEGLASAVKGVRQVKNNLTVA